MASFELDIRVRGEALGERGEVRFYESGHERVRAEIVMGEEYADVRLEIAGRTLEIECDCQAGACHHVWAVLKAAESAGELSKACRRSVDKQPRIIGGGAPDDVELEYCRDERVSANSLRRRSTVQVPAAAIAFNSRPRFQETRGEAGDGTPEIELNYVIVAPAGRTGETTVVRTCWRSRRADGTWSERRPFEFKPFEPPPQAEDDAILSLIGPAYNRRESAFELMPGLAARALPLMAASGRLYWSRGASDCRQTPLAWDSAEPWVFRLEITPDDGTYIVQGSLVRPQEQASLSQLDYVCEGGLAAVWTRLGGLDHRNAFDWLRRLRQEEAFVLPRHEVEVFMRRVYLDTALDTDHFPEELQYRTETPSVGGRLYVRTAKYKYRGSEQLHAELSFDYEGVVVDEDEQGERLVHAGKRQLMVRALDQEEACRNLLRTLDFRHVTCSTREEPGWKLHPGKLDKAVRSLVGQDWLVVAQGKTCRKPTEKKAAISGDRQDWFDLKGSVQFGDEAVPLPILLALVKRGESYVVLDDGTLGVLPTEWLEKYTALTEIAQDNGEALSFRRSQAALLDALCADLEVATDQAFDEVRRHVRDFAGFTPAEAPPTFQGRLRDYQRLGLGWMRMLHRLGVGGCLADDMGLGKTVQVLALLEYRRLDKPGKPSLVVLPKSLIFNWQSEAARFAPRMRVMVHAGATRRTDVAAFDHADVVLTTYGTVRMDAHELRHIPLDYCILDESQAIKNADTAVAKAVRLLQADHRLAMSGTPVENRVGELFSQFDFLNPGMLGRLGLAGAGGSELSGEVLERIVRGLRPFILRRRKEEVATDLPPKSELTLYCDLEPEQRRHYDNLRVFYQNSLLKQQKAQRDGGKRTDGARPIEILEALLRLRQCACHPGLVNEKYRNAPSAKLEVLVETLAELNAEGHKALVFSQFTSFLGMVRNQLEPLGIGYAYLDGQTKDRQEQVDAFQADPAKAVFLISLKAGGVGLNLTAAEYVFLLDPWWNPAVEAQAVDRAYRIGQTRNVFAYRVIAKDTVEEKILAMQADKRELADALIASNTGFIRQLSADDLAYLFE